jgi:DNA adenine methylase
MLEPMSYPGGKNGAGVYQKIINLMPPHDRYFEPFLGGGAILRLKRPARENVACDLVASQVSAVSAALAKFGAAAAASSPTMGPARHESAETAIADDPRSRTAKSSERCRSPNATMEASSAESGDGIRYRLFEGCAIALLEKASTFTARDLVYCDPPYLMETRSGRKLYEHELSDVDHRRLLRCIRKLPAMVMISGYWSSLYAQMLEGWNSISFEAMTRGGHTATEWLWFNFPTPVELHDYRFLGENFRERERIKRKKVRWTERLKRMPILEKQSLLSAIAAIADTAGTGERIQDYAINLTAANPASPIPSQVTQSGTPSMMVL